MPAEMTTAAAPKSYENSVAVETPAFAVFKDPFHGIALYF